MTKLYENRDKSKDGQSIIPTWFMRQAGRYHTHYQGFRKKYDFMTMCKTPELATEITMGPIEDFKFDGAILFSDLLFPLEHLGMGLNYNQGPPALKFHLESVDDVKKLAPIESAKSYYKFQQDALFSLRKRLPKDTSLLGFVGAPFTLYTYAVEGSHKGSLVNSKAGLYNGLFEKFLEKLIPSVQEEMRLQLESPIDNLCLFDTAAGELTPEDFKTFIVPALREVLKPFVGKYPGIKITYYTKHSRAAHYDAVMDLPIDVIGVDWKYDLRDSLDRWGERFYVQGNFDPCWLHIEWKEIEKKLEHIWSSMKGSKNLNKWIFGLGHGVLPKTPEENVRNIVNWVHNNMRY